MHAEGPAWDILEEIAIKDLTAKAHIGARCCAMARATGALHCAANTPRCA
jgi:hypothetical protein